MSIAPIAISFNAHSLFVELSILFREPRRRHLSRICSPSSRIKKQVRNNERRELATGLNVMSQPRQGASDRARSGGGIVNHATQFNKASCPFPLTDASRYNAEEIANVSITQRVPLSGGPPDASSQSQNAHKIAGFLLSLFPALSSRPIPSFTFQRARINISCDRGIALCTRSPLDS